MTIIVKEQIGETGSFHSQMFLTTSSGKEWPYGQPGQMPSGNFRCLIDCTNSAKFYKLVT